MTLGRRPAEGKEVFFLFCFRLPPVSLLVSALYARGLDVDHPSPIIEAEASSITPLSVSAAVYNQLERRRDGAHSARVFKALKNKYKFLLCHQTCIEIRVARRMLRVCCFSELEKVSKNI